MAGNIQSNIHINVTSNAEQTFNDIRETSRGLFDSLSQDINNINNTFNDIRETSRGLFDSLSEPVGFDNTVDSIESLGDATNEMNINTDSLVNSLLQMASTGKLSSASMLAFGKSLGVPTLAITALSTSIKLGIDQVENFIDDMKQLGEVLGDGTSFAIDGIVDSLGLLVDGLKEASEAMIEFSEYGIAIQGDYYSMYNFLEDDAVEAIDKYANSLKDLYGINPNTYISNLEGILSVAHNVAKTAEEQVAVVTTLNNTAYDLFAKTGGAYGDINQVKNHIEGAINLGILNRNSSITKALDLTTEMREEFKQLGDATERYNWILEKTTGIQGLYTKWLQTESGQVELLRQQYQLLIGNIGQLALGLYAKIAPVLNMLLELANNVLNKISSLFGIDLKNSAMQNSANSYSKVADSIKEIGEAADASKRKVSKFDDVIQINDNGKLDNTLSNNFGDLTFSNDWLDNIEEGKSKIKELADQLKELFEQGKYYEAGRLLADTLKGWLKDIPWEDIRREAEWTGLYLANFLNGLLADAELFAEIGNFFAQSINTAFQYLLGFARNFDFKQLGTDLGTAWDEYWKNLDSKIIGESVYEWFMGGFETLNGMIEAGSLSTATGKIADIIIDFFSNITEEDITLMADTLIGTIDEVFDAVATFIDKMEEHPEIKDKLLQLLKNTIENIGENAEEWGTTANELITNILGFIGDTLETTNDDGTLAQSIRTFLDNLDPVEIMVQWFKIKMEMKELAFHSIGTTVIDMVLTGIVLGLTDGLSTIELAFDTLKEYILGKMIEAKMEIFKFIYEFGLALTTLIFNIKFDILDIFLPDEFVQKGRDLFNGLMQGIIEGWNNIKEWWNQNVAGALSINIPEFAKGIIGSDTLTISIPKLATGGIVARSTVVNVGEDGAEAVLPLEKNTGWMDSLATKLASKINVAQSNGSGNIILPLSDLNKAFYTRNEMIEFAEMVVESLKVYGVNVAVVG